MIKKSLLIIFNPFFILNKRRVINKFKIVKYINLQIEIYIF